MFAADVQAILGNQSRIQAQMMDINRENIVLQQKILDLNRLIEQTNEMQHRTLTRNFSTTVASSHSDINFTCDLVYNRTSTLLRAATGKRFSSSHPQSGSILDVPHDSTHNPACTTQLSTVIDDH